MNQNVELNSLKHQLSTSFLAGTPFSRVNWHIAKSTLESLFGSLSDEHLAAVIVDSTIKHPLAIQYPRSSVYVHSFLSWLNEFWASKNLKGGHLFKSETYEMDLEIGYNTYFLGSQSVPVTLLESHEGISRGTTGLRSWGAARVLASWCLDNNKRIRGRILELGSGIGFTASTLLSSPEGRENIVSYTASDYHPHVLTILHHNLSLLPNLQTEESAISKEERLRFCSTMNQQLSKDELEPGDFREWQQLDDFQEEGKVPRVCVRQIDWRSPGEILQYDVILAADVVYALHLLPYLVNIIREALKRHTFEASVNNTNQGTNKEGGSELMGRCIEPLESKSRAFIACTRRNQETISEFLSELTKQNLKFKEVYQMNLNREESVFSFDESHLPVKIFEVTHHHKKYKNSPKP